MKKVIVVTDGAKKKIIGVNFKRFLLSLKLDDLKNYQYNYNLDKGLKKTIH
jgi:hypothetical protein